MYLKSPPMMSRRVPVWNGQHGAGRRQLGTVKAVTARFAGAVAPPQGARPLFNVAVAAVDGVRASR
jgi:hypothetical protein